MTGALASSTARVGSKENRTFVIGRLDRKAWYDTLVPFLRGQHTEVVGDGGAARDKQKANILRFVEGERKNEVLKWEEEPARDLIPWYNSDNDLQHSSWDSTSPKSIIHGIGIYFEADDDGEQAEEELYAIYRKSYEDVKDLNARIRRQLSRCPQV